MKKELEEHIGILKVALLKKSKDAEDLKSKCLTAAAVVKKLINEMKEYKQLINRAASKNGSKATASRG